MNKNLKAGVDINQVSQMYVFTRKFPSDLQRADRTVRQMVGLLSKILEEDQLFDIRFILNELVVNSVEHGNRFDRSKTVNLEVVVTDQCVKLVVRDQGKGIRYSFENYDKKSLRPDGRGLYICAQLADDFAISGNEIICTLKRADLI